MKLKWCLSFVVLTSTFVFSASTPPLFSALTPGQTLPPEFRVITLPKLTPNQFSLVADEGKTVLRVESANSAGSVGIPFTARSRNRVGEATLTWRWKVDRVLEKADMTQKLGDDFAARVYVFFDVPMASLPFFDRVMIRLARLMSGADVPTAALCYVWDNRQPAGHTAWSAYTGRVRMIVMQSGTTHVGQWKSESRDVASDFRDAFGIEAPAVTGVALGNDTDNTHDHVTAWFGDLAFAALDKPGQ